MYKNNINIYAYNTLFKFKSRWKRVLREWGFRLTLRFKRLILYIHPNLWHFGLKKNILNLVLKGVPEKYVGCLLVYPFYATLFFLKKEKKVLQDDGFEYAIKLNQTNQYHTTDQLPTSK